MTADVEVSHIMMRTRSNMWEGHLPCDVLADVWLVLGIDCHTIILLLSNCGWFREVRETSCRGPCFRCARRLRVRRRCLLPLRVHR